MKEIGSFVLGLFVGAGATFIIFKNLKEKANKEQDVEQIIKDSEPLIIKKNDNEEEKKRYDKFFKESEVSKKVKDVKDALSKIGGVVTNSDESENKNIIFIPEEEYGIYTSYHTSEYTAEKVTNGEYFFTILEDDDESATHFDMESELNEKIYKELCEKLNNEAKDIYIRNNDKCMDYHIINALYYNISDAELYYVDDGEDENF